MTKPFQNPAVRAFADAIGGEDLTFGQVLIRRVRDHFELRHWKDRNAAESALRRVEISGLYDIALLTEDGKYRPLKSTPDLKSGWIACAGDLRELETGMDYLYPGGLDDWHACHLEEPTLPPMSEMLARQTGRYAKLKTRSRAQCEASIGECCHPSACLKARLWKIDRETPAPIHEKPTFICLEPCAMLLEKLWSKGFKLK